MTTIHKGFCVFAITAACLLWAALPVLASADTNPPGDRPSASGQLTQEEAGSSKQLSMTELYEKVKECRQSLLERRMDVVKEANEAKQRLEELIKNSKHSAQSTEALRRDLDIIKEAQRVLATILSDIVNAGGAQQETIPSREYLEGLVVLYDEKTQHLARIVESLNGVVLI